jgi:hypothetical protein
MIAVPVAQLKAPFHGLKTEFKLENALQKSFERKLQVFGSGAFNGIEFTHHTERQLAQVFVGFFARFAISSEAEVAVSVAHLKALLSSRFVAAPFASYIMGK